jgi:hypothetical protein
LPSISNASGQFIQLDIGCGFGGVNGAQFARWSLRAHGPNAATKEKVGTGLNRPDRQHLAILF